MRINHDLRDYLNKKFGEGNWEVRHANHWSSSIAVANKKRIKPNRGWAVAVCVGGEWKKPSHAVANQEELIGAI